MEEQSHKSEMRAALRGDFDRMRARQGRIAPEAGERATTRTSVAEETPEPGAASRPRRRVLDLLRRGR